MRDIKYVFRFILEFLRSSKRAIVEFLCSVVTFLRSFVKLLRSSKRTILLLTITAVMTLVIGTITAMWLNKTMNSNIPNFGAVKTLGVEVYWDLNLTNKTEHVNWGTIFPSSSQNVTLYVKSISNTETNLHINAANWNPADLSKYMTLTWNYNGTKIQQNETIKITITLTATSHQEFKQYLITNNIKQFNFDIIISATE